jgi:hypothetical protein
MELSHPRTMKAGDILTSLFTRVGKALAAISVPTGEKYDNGVGGYFRPRYYPFAKPDVTVWRDAEGTWRMTGHGLTLSNARRLPYAGRRRGRRFLLFPKSRERAYQQWLLRVDFESWYKSQVARLPDEERREILRRLPEDDKRERDKAFEAWKKSPQPPMWPDRGEVLRRTKDRENCRA